MRSEGWAAHHEHAGSSREAESTDGKLLVDAADIVINLTNYTGPEIAQLHVVILHIQHSVT